MRCLLQGVAQGEEPTNSKWDSTKSAGDGALEGILPVCAAAAWVGYTKAKKPLSYGRSHLS